MVHAHSSMCLPSSALALPSQALSPMGQPPSDGANLRQKKHDVSRATNSAESTQESTMAPRAQSWAPHSLVHLQSIRLWSYCPPGRPGQQQNEHGSIPEK